MKKLKTKLSYALYTLIVACTFTACTVDSSRVQKDTIENTFDNGIEILTIDKCEYVWMSTSSTDALTHKGNCKNTEHTLTTK